jgi:hypothetical protein
MITTTTAVPLTSLTARCRPHLPALVPGLVAVGLFLVWAVHDGGFDDDTWYWGALVAVAVLGATLVLLGRRRLRASRLTRAAIALFALYVAWSYLSMTWAQAPGVALDGSNRALLYLVVFTLLTLLPWTAEGAIAALLTFAVGVGVIAFVLLVRLASADNVGALVIGGRLAAPTGYYNATAALFTMDALVAAGLASRRELPGVVRGLLVALAGCSLQLAVVVQSRGWLFTLPIVILLAVLVVRDRVRVAVAAAIPIAVTLIPVHRLLHIYDSAQGPGLNQAARQAGREALVLFAAAFVVATLLAWLDQIRRPARVSAARARVVGGLVAVVAIAGGCAGALAVTHGHPFGFIERQWNGFSHEQSSSTGSHFTDVGSGRYDFWRVSLDAFKAHPIGGLGQDNFADYYVKLRHTGEEPEWTHSLELRLLSHTGIVGFLLFTGFMVCAIVAAVRARRRGPPVVAAVAGIALLPLVVWLIHGSIDWFWEIPALSGPALGFLGMAGALARAPQVVPAGWTVSDQPGAAPMTSSRSRVPAYLTATGAGLLAVAAIVVLAFPYLSVQEVSLASNISSSDPTAALADLADAAKLNPLSSDPGRLAGAIALQTGRNQVAQQRFRQSIRREPGGWFSWLGAGLAASALGDRETARRDFETAYSINNQQPAIKQALDRVDTPHPLTSAEAFKLLVVVD